METPSERLERIMSDVAALHYVTMDAVRGPGKDKQLMDARRAVCQTLRDMGLSTPMIGAKINRDHTSVLNLLGALKRNKKKKANPMDVKVYFEDKNIADGWEHVADFHLYIHARDAARALGDGWQRRTRVVDRRGGSVFTLTYNPKAKTFHERVEEMAA
jgi:hypothetical protein